MTARVVADRLFPGASVTVPLFRGVAQGSLVGPMFFFNFINDLLKFLHHGHLLSYETQPLDSAVLNAVGLSNQKVRVEKSIYCIKNCFKSNSAPPVVRRCNAIIISPVKIRSLLTPEIVHLTLSTGRYTSSQTSCAYRLSVWRETTKCKQVIMWTHLDLIHETNMN